MDISKLHGNWTTLVPHLRHRLPHSQVPDIYPRGPLCDALLSRLAQAHDLTRAEVIEIIEEEWMFSAPERDVSRAA